MRNRLLSLSILPASLALYAPTHDDSTVQPAHAASSAPTITATGLASPVATSSVTYQADSDCTAGWSMWATLDTTVQVPQWNPALGSTLRAVRVEVVPICGWDYYGQFIASIPCTTTARLQMARADNWCDATVLLGTTPLDSSGEQRIPQTLSGAATPTTSGTHCDMQTGTVINLQQSTVELSDGHTLYSGPGSFLAQWVGVGNMRLQLLATRAAAVNFLLPCGGGSLCGLMYSLACPGQEAGWQVRVYITYIYD